MKGLIEKLSTGAWTGKEGAKAKADERSSPDKRKRPPGRIGGRF
jgi:hypothetical protein